MTAKMQMTSVPRANGRSAVTLVEIMASILVLSIGLVGVLAAVPFGGFRLAQMNEADNSGAAGRNARNVMTALQWENPSRWWLVNASSTSGDFFTVANPLNPSDASDRLIGTNASGSNSLNLNCPFVIDPLGQLNPSTATNASYLPFALGFRPNSGYAFAMTHVFPMEDGFETNKWPVSSYYAQPGAVISLGDWTTRLSTWYSRLFYQQDDVVFGVSSSEDETYYRPQVEMENDEWVNRDAPSFLGGYSWLATVRLKTDAEKALYSAASISDVTGADCDIVIMKDRIPGDEKVFSATLNGVGVQGGDVVIDLTTALGVNSPTAANASLNAWLGVGENTEADRLRVVEQLEQTRWIMLIGSDDVYRDGSGVGTFFAWYKIANYSVTYGNTVKKTNPRTVRLSLIGPDMPLIWQSGSTPVSAVFYPGAVGVFSGSPGYNSESEGFR